MHRCKLFLFGYCVPSHFINERNDEQGRDEGEKLDPGSRGRQKKKADLMSFPTNPNVGINLAQNFPSTPALDSFRKKLHFKHGLGILDNNFRTADFLLAMECRALYQYNNTIMWRDQTSTSDHPPRTCHGPSIGHGCRKRKRLYDIWMPSSISSR